MTRTGGGSASAPAASFVRRRFRRGLALLLTAVGLLQIAGSILGAPLLMLTGALSGAAPLPLVFSRQEGIAGYARRATVELRTTDGATHAIPVDRSFGRRVEGPLARRAAYAHAALFAGIRPGAHDALLRRAFCEPGDVARELGVTAPVRRVRVGSWSALAADEPSGGTELDCRAAR